MRPFRFLLFFLLLAPSLFALDIPPAPTQWYTDKAGLLSPTDAAALNRKLEAFEQRSGAQFIIYVLPSIENEAIEDWSIRTVTQWKVGQKKYDNGLVLFVFQNEKKIRTEVGYGLEGTITDAFSSRVTREVIAPFFQRGDFAGGLNAGADALMEQISKGEAPVEPNQSPAGRGQPQSAMPQIPGWVFLLFFIFVFFVLPKLFGGGRRRGGGCGGPGCLPLLFLPGGGGGITFGGGGGGFGGGFGGGGGGFSGGGGGFGGGGSTGGW